MLTNEVIKAQVLYTKQQMLQKAKVKPGSSKWLAIMNTPITGAERAKAAEHLTIVMQTGHRGLQRRTEQPTAKVARGGVNTLTGLGKTPFGRPVKFGVPTKPRNTQRK